MENVKELIVEETVNGAGEDAIEVVVDGGLSKGAKIGLAVAVCGLAYLAYKKGLKPLVAKIKAKKAAKATEECSCCEECCCEKE